MAELHRFQDDAKDRPGRIAPIRARFLDENFRTVRLELSDSLASFLKITKQKDTPDTLDFVVQPPSAESVPVFSGGFFSEWKETGFCE